MRKFLIGANPIGWLLCALLGVFIFLYYVGGSPRQRGFYCDDQSIRYPYREGTISAPALAAVSVTIFLLVVFVCESLHVRLSPRHLCSSQTMDAKRRLFVAVYTVWAYFTLGLCCCHLLVDIAKYQVGRLRPHFVQVCDPIVHVNNSTHALLRHTAQGAVYNCSFHQATLYIEQYTCANPDTALVRQARLSFPSGHSSVAFYSMVFIIVYLRRCVSARREGLRGVGLLRVLATGVQYLCLLFACFVALSRVHDYKHHPGDVIAGSIVGTVFAVAFSQMYTLSGDNKVANCDAMSV